MASRDWRLVRARVAAMVVALSSAYCAAGSVNVPQASATVTSPGAMQNIMCPEGEIEATFNSTANYTYGISMSGVAHSYNATMWQRLDDEADPGQAILDGQSDPDELGFWSDNWTNTVSRTAGISSHQITAYCEISITDLEPNKNASATSVRSFSVIPYEG